jgi:hypothetical protein
MNLESGDAPLVLLCPAWKKWGTARTVKQNTTILHSRADDVVPFSDSEELVRNSGLPASALIEVGDDHRMADPAGEGLDALALAVEEQPLQGDGGPQRRPGVGKVVGAQRGVVAQPAQDGRVQFRSIRLHAWLEA